MLAREIWSKVLLLYKTNRFHFAVGLYSDNAQRTSKHGKNISHALTSSVRYQSTDARQNEIYLTNKEASTVLCSVVKHAGSG